MSPRDSFWFLAGALVAVAIMVTVRAWLRERPAAAERPVGRPAIPAFAVPIAAALALIGVALGIYFLLGSPDSIASSHAITSAVPAQQTQMGQPSPQAGRWTTSQTSWLRGLPRREAQTTTGSFWRSRTSTWGEPPKQRRQRLISRLRRPQRRETQRPKAQRRRSPAIR